MHVELRIGPDEAAALHKRLCARTGFQGLTLYEAIGVLERSHVDNPMCPYFVLAAPDGEKYLHDLEFFQLIEGNLHTDPKAKYVGGGSEGAYKVKWKKKKQFL